ncbi:MAG: ATP-binding protein [Candidatus Omnitrophica bacterium]|nr:ATP-binding protein [Candidatus Omnitrophota bacterium]MBU1133714.1 ATP-binding protein [Candidatus Omnitrophota bacterium]MBU1366192.1 ATP-binding protein [Candidatus Omnitrophota bacterium]MBU1524220.1 ATP-binding protein [Candidatus Omnitrophota bacterium]MBU1810017.1 ATP-binding protein [Candidatus Omnitrophota bacterium]
MMELKERIRLIFKETNPWWKKGNFQLENYSCRLILLEIEKFFSFKQIIALVGLRRTGKTTLILKIIEFFLQTLKPQQILYFSFDDFSQLEIEELISVYREIFPELNLKEGKFLFCFDEVQKLQNWQEKFKRLYDTYPNIKIIISGSESLFLRKKIKETLAGRIFEFKVLPLNFKEYIYFTKNESILSNTQLYKEEILKLYKEFLKTNGFPELAGIKDTMIIHKYLKESVIDKIIFQDIPQLFKVKNVDILAEILDIIIFSPGQLMDITRLAKELSLSRQVVSLYLDYLEKSFLIKKLYNFSKNLRKQKRSLKKYYPAIIFPSIVEDNFPLCFENSLVWQLDAQFFYRNAYKNEIDIILVGKNKKIIPIEIKTGRIELASINYFMKKYRPAEIIIITLDKEEKQKQIKIIPFYKYLLKK